MSRYCKSATKSNRIAAVETNNADAAMLTPPMTLQARKLGMTLLLDASKLNIPYSSLLFVARKPYLSKMRAELVNFTKAMIEGVALYKSNKEFAMKVLSKYMKVQDREVLEENFREYDFPLKPYPSREYFDLPIQEVGKKDPKVLKENPERYTDLSLVKELESSGFHRKNHPRIPCEVTRPPIKLRGRVIPNKSEGSRINKGRNINKENKPWQAQEARHCSVPINSNCASIRFRTFPPMAD